MAVATSPQGWASRFRYDGKLDACVPAGPAPARCSSQPGAVARHEVPTLQHRYAETESTAAQKQKPRHTEAEAAPLITKCNNSEA
jgi:hypothetical protein